MTYVGTVVLAALHHWVNATPRGDERAASLNMTGQSENIECSHGSDDSPNKYTYVAV